MDIGQSGCERFELRNPGRWLRHVWLPFWALFVAWIPLTWYYGNIASRTVGSAIYFFAAMLGGAAVMFLAWQRMSRALGDPGMNFVEVQTEALIVILPGMRRTVIKYRDIKGIESASVHGATGKMIVRLRRFNICMLFSGLGGPRQVRLDVVEPAEFLTAVNPHIAERE